MMDGTFDQEKAVLYVNTLKSIPGKFYSFDLSAATDRLPVLLQARLLEPLIGVRRSRA